MRGTLYQDEIIVVRIAPAAGTDMLYNTLMYSKHTRLWIFIWTTILYFEASVSKPGRGTSILHTSLKDLNKITDRASSQNGQNGFMCGAAMLGPINFNMQIECSDNKNDSDGHTKSLEAYIDTLWRNISRSRWRYFKYMSLLVAT